jgi:hypothetical protein
MAIIYTYPTKAFPTSEDLVLISDAADSNKTKNAKISSIQSLVSGVNSVNGLADAVLLDSTTGVSNNNLTRTTTPGTNTISYQLADHLNDITVVEEGDFNPTLEYMDKSSGDWFEWTVNPDGTPNADRTYDTGSNFSGKYTRVNNGVILRFRCYAINAGSAFDVGGLRIAMPFSFFSGNALSVSFTQSLANAANNNTSISRTWVSGNRCYLLQENVDAGTDTTVFPAGVPQVYFSTFSTSLTYRLGSGTTFLNAGGACRIND